MTLQTYESKSLESREKLETIRVLTGSFRHSIARKHDRKKHVANGQAAYLKRFAYTPDRRDAIEELEATSMWHKRRANGQRNRIENLLACGAKTGQSSCEGCGGTHTFLVGCGVNRLCDQCSTKNAIKRRARFSMARAARVLDANRSGLFQRRRTGIKAIPKNIDAQLFGVGAFSEKMVTLTVPHFGDDVQCVKERIDAIFEAWKIFSRSMQRDLRRRRKWDPMGQVWMHRAFEWTPGGDALGHPHFHVWLLCPFISLDVLREMWTEALELAGIGMEGFAVVNITRFETLSPALAREIIKGGQKKALNYSGKKESNEIGSAFDYADGWAISDVWDQIESDVLAEIYKALEGKRLSQGSRGFYDVGIEKVQGDCRHCGEHGCLRITFTPTVAGMPATETQSRDTGPP